METVASNVLQFWDYFVLCIMLLISASIGIFYASTGGRQKTTKEYLMADHNMGVLPVALSLMVSFVSAITLLGTAAEMYQYGTQYWMIGPCYLIVVAVAGYILMPVLFKLNITSVNEYLERRFNKVVRLQACITFIFQMTTYMGIVLYAPTLALNAVTGLNWHLSVFIIGIVSTFYTTIGGMKAVMWTDVFQASLMFSGMIAVSVLGTLHVGGVSAVFDSLSRGQRLELWNLDPNPLERHTLWTLIFGGATAWLVMYGVNQSQVQRYLSTRSIANARRAIWINGPGLFALMSLSCYTGLVAFTYYEHCDPLTAGRISKGDQILPLFVIEVLNYPGFAGFFISAIFSGALSTLSSGLNALAAVTLEDLVKPSLCLLRVKRPLTDGGAAFISKIIAAVFGFAAIGMAFVAGHMGDVLSSFLGVHGMIGGPVLGLFLLGVLFPRANWKGACFGHLFGEIMSLWVGIGGTVHKYPYKKAPLLIDQCSNASIALDFALNVTNSTDTVSYTGLNIYRLSYLYRGTWAVFCTVTMGIIVSLLTAEKEQHVQSGLLWNSCEKLYSWMPRAMREWICNPIYETTQKEATITNGHCAETESL